jgi:hypothetical protein
MLSYEPIFARNAGRDDGVTATGADGGVSAVGTACSINPSDTPSQREEDISESK